MRFPLQTTTFAYQVCQETFPAGREDDWVDYIRHAFEQWELATNSTVKSILQNTDPCTDYATGVIDESRNKSKLHAGNYEDLNGEVKGFIKRIRWTNIRPWQIHDSRKSEVIMLDDKEALGLGARYSARAVFICSQLGSGVELVGKEDLGNTAYRCWTVAPCCAVATAMVGSNVRSTDIFVLRSKVTAHEDPPLTFPGGDKQLYRSDVQFNVWPSNVLDGYRVLVHEVGHALGLRSGGGSPDHSKLNDTVMSEAYSVAQCSPHPLYVLAIRALYESR